MCSRCNAGCTQASTKNRCISSALHRYRALICDNVCHNASLPACFLCVQLGLEHALLGYNLHRRWPSSHAISPIKPTVLELATVSLEQRQFEQRTAPIYSGTAAGATAGTSSCKVGVRRVLQGNARQHQGDCWLDVTSATYVSQN